MTETICSYLLQTALLNAVIAGLLMLVAWMLSRRLKSPAFASAMWTIVLLKLLTPPLILLPVTTAQWESNVAQSVLDQKDATDQQDLFPSAEGMTDRSERAKAVIPTQRMPILDTNIRSIPESKFATADDLEGNVAGADELPENHRVARGSTIPTFHFAWSTTIPLVAAFWLCGTLGFAWSSLSRLISFRVRVQQSENAPEWIVADIRRVASVAGLRAIPCVKVVDCHISPSIGCWGSQPTLILPRHLYVSLSDIERRTLIAHELAHVLRCDHWRAWLEATVLTVFWWYPLAWFACRECRRATERCCDGWVLKWFPENAAEYAETLLKSVDFISSARQGMPVVIHGIGDFATMKQRIVTILSVRTEPFLSRPVKGGVGLIAIAILAAGIQFAQSRHDSLVPAAWADEGSIEQGASPAAPKAQPRPGDIVFVTQSAQVCGTGGSVQTVKRGTALRVETVNEDTFVVKEVDGGPGDDSGSIDKNVVAISPDAIEIFSRQIRENPSDAGAFAARGIVRRREAEIDFAIEDFNEAIRLNPQDAGVYIERGIARGSKDSEKQLADFADAIQLDPQSVTAHKHRLAIFVLRQDIENAKADYEQILLLKPQDPFAITFHLMIAGLQKHDDDIAKLSHGIGLDPENPSLYFERAEIYKEKLSILGVQLHLDGFATDKTRKWRDNAIADYSAAIRLAPRLAKALKGRGKIWFDSREYELAIKDYTAALEIDLRDADAYYRRGLGWNEVKKHDAAIADFTEVIRIDSKHGAAYKARGDAWEQSQNDDRAIEDYTTALRSLPRQFRFGIGFGIKNDVQPFADAGSKLRASVYRHRGAILAKKLDYKSAVTDYNDSLLHDPKDHATVKQLAWLLATCPDPSHRNGEKAIEYAITACKRGKWRDASDMNALAAAYAETGNFAKAVELQQRACGRVTEIEQSSYFSRLELYKAGKPFRDQPTNLAGRESPSGLK